MIKVVTYILLFCILLFCAIAQKIALVILTADQYNVTGTSSVSEQNVSIDISIVHLSIVKDKSSIIRWGRGRFRERGGSDFILVIY